ncbi:MmgE/PrpD family protein [Luteimonas sp. e5]
MVITSGNPFDHCKSGHPGPMHAIEELASFVAQHPEGALPLRTQEKAALLLTDLMAAAAAGLNSSLARATRAAAVALHGPGDAKVWLTGQSLTIAGAAMANAAAASALDIDDGHRGAAGHPGAGIIPAVLAVGQSMGADDACMLDAMVLGYDVALRIASSRPPPTIETYCSGRWVAFGVAAAAGRLLGLGAHQIAHAMAMAGAESPVMLPRSRLGSSVKEGIPPAVVVGLAGAFRARAGATGPVDLLDDDEHFSRNTMLSGLGESWWLEQCYLKPYACCRYMHAAIDAIVALRQPGKPILDLGVETFPEGLRLSNAKAPQTLEGGQYSYYFSCAVAALYGAEALQPVDSALLADQDVRDIAQRMRLSAHEDFVAAFPATTPCRVTLDQGAGPRMLTVQHPLGDFHNPMSKRQVVDKFRRVTAENLSPQKQEEVLAALDGVATHGFGPLFAALDGTESAESETRLTVPGDGG